MAYRFTHAASTRRALQVVAAILSTIILASCTYGPRQIRARITNVIAKPNSHLIAVAVQYEEFRNATGINAFPNGGVPKRLNEKAKIYLCDVETLEIRRLASITPTETVRLGWEPWILGWLGDSLFFRISGQQGTKHPDFKLNKTTYKIDPEGRTSEVENAPTNLVFQKNTGPLPQSAFVRVSTGYNTIDVRTENDRTLRTLFRTETTQGELVAVKGSNNASQETSHPRRP